MMDVENPKKCAIFSEIAKNVDEFLEAEIILNESQFNAMDSIEFRISIPFTILVENLRIISLSKNITLYEAYKSLNLEETIKNISDRIENNK